MKKLILAVVAIAVAGAGAYAGMRLLQSRPSPASVSTPAAPSAASDASKPPAQPTSSAAAPAAALAAPAQGVDAAGIPNTQIAPPAAPSGSTTTQPSAPGADRGLGAIMSAAGMGGPPSSSSPAASAPAANAPPSSAPAQSAPSPSAAGSASRTPAAPVSAARPAHEPVAPAGPPPTLTDVDVASMKFGGDVERMTGAFGPGYTGHHLIDGRTTPTWKIAAPVVYPQEIVFSFFERQPVLVGAVAIALPEDASLAPKDVEVLASPDSATSGFVQVAEQRLAARSGEQTIAFSPIEARYLKLRVLSGASDKGLEIAEVRVIEATRPGYVALFMRQPRATWWDGSARAAAQRGLDWLEQSAPDWQKLHACFGCHVQSEVLMGQAIAMKQHYRVSPESVRTLEEGVRKDQQPDGSWFGGSTSATAFGMLGLFNVNAASGATADAKLSHAADWLIAHQRPDGSIAVDAPNPPLIAGRFLTAANALPALDWVAAHSSDPKYRAAENKILSWVESNGPEAESTQDMVFKIIMLSSYGTPGQKQAVQPLIDQLQREQQPDGGWKVFPAASGTNPLTTGQVLYALKVAGVSVESPVFGRGVLYLLRRQIVSTNDDDGAWPKENTQSIRPSNFAATMWAVIGLAGSYGLSSTGALHVTADLPRVDKPTRNLEIVLDVSGSMRSKLGTSTRWNTAMAVLKQVLGVLTDDTSVGLRVYGHRYAPTDRQSCTDTEAIVPIGKIDRSRILSVASSLAPRGQTPLVYSVLQTPADLRAAGGGAVIVITDGEESCRGDLKKAAAQLKASGVDVNLNIVGFTLAGKTAESQLAGLAESTGGRYYAAKDGDQLSRVLMLATLHAVPYDVVDASGRTVMSAQTGDAQQELTPGSYHVRFHTPGQELNVPVTIAADHVTSLTIAMQGDRFEVKQ